MKQPTDRAAALHFFPTAVSEIGAQLAEMFDSPSADGERGYLRIGSTNLLVVYGLSSPFAEVERLVQGLSVVHPSRFFLVSEGEPGGGLRAEISARCQMLSKTEYICQEVVRLTVSPERLAALPSVLRANLVTGAECELLILDQYAPQDFVHCCRPLCQRVFVDSQRLAGGTAELAALAADGSSLVDLAWLRICPWIESSGLILAGGRLSSGLPRLQSIVVSAAAGGWQSALLYTGWVMARLGLRLPTFKEGAVSCSSRFGHPVQLRLATVAGESAGNGISGVSFNFAPYEGEIAGTALSVDNPIRRAVSAGGQVMGNPSDQLDNQGWAQALARLFGGDFGTAEYSVARRYAADLASLLTQRD